MDDPFQYHPGLRALIRDPETSFFRGLDAHDLVRRHPEFEWEKILTPKTEREAGRLAALEGRREKDLWVFAYGSLMWDPGFHFTKVRRAHLPTHARRFILYDTRGARGTAEHPGLMAALDHGAGCDGLAFCIDRDLIEEETQHIWGRERIGPAYCETFVPIELGETRVEALTFVADHASDSIRPDLTRAQQVEALARGVGILGTSIEYIRNLAAGLAELGVEDRDLTGLLEQAEARLAEIEGEQGT